MRQMGVRAREYAVRECAIGSMCGGYADVYEKILR
jgi:hypothetical protein